jgi:predicted transcriptional regulator
MERPVDLQKILSDLEAEKDRIVRAIEALVQIGSSSRGARKTKGRPKGGRRRGGMTPEARRRISLAMKKRWAERKKKMG